MPVSTDAQKIEELLSRGVEEVIEKDNLRKKLLSGKRLRIKFGIDPTGSQMHIGHAVPLRKLKQFQELGHQVILLIGDYTAMIGDPSGRDSTRPVLTLEDVKKNMKTYVKQAGKVIDTKKIEIRHNSEWYGKSNATGLLMELTSKITVARILERDDFQKRLKSGSDIQMQEIMYPLLQGYDSVMLKADVEIGGTDQKFNLLMGRKLQKKYDQAEQEIMTIPLLVGTDGEKKMSKSYGNYIALDDSPEEMFGKTMSIPDSLIIKYFELTTEEPMEKILAYKKDLENGKNPMKIKMELARSLTRLYHGEAGEKKGENNFTKTFSKKEIPDVIPELKPNSYDIITVLAEAFTMSRSLARRNIQGGGVKINSDRNTDIYAKVKPGDVVQKGRFFVKIK
jgi:tyrosyl-tRNA synthetase